MIREFDTRVNPDVGFDEFRFREHVIRELKLETASIVEVQMIRRSVDARSSRVKVNIKARVFVDEVFPREVFQKKYPDVSAARPVIVVGAGPSGLFAALRLIELGLKPILLERGKDVRSRRRDLAAINKEQFVNPDSNYCFGEGGAGTYSDGKLYTRSKKRGDLRRILEILVAHGARKEILIDAHPHIGTNKLPKIVEALRMSVLDAGGEVHFDQRVCDLIIDFQKLIGVKTLDGTSWKAEAVILATGHSARDIFYLLHKYKIRMEFKPFAMGVRVEHPQSLIDQIQYHSAPRSPFLPAASYALVEQVRWKKSQRGVFSFCMCPGGFIVPAATQQEEIVVNGMSPSRRDSEFANSGIVVAIEKEDLNDFEHYGAFAGLELQKNIERKAWEAGGRKQVAPAQLLMDFVERKQSVCLHKSSYQPGLIPVMLDNVLPPEISFRLREAFKLFGKRMKGYLTNEAQIVAVESRTSSPVCIPRDNLTLEHVSLSGLFPCGEGAGYAGGIISAAMDGERVADAVGKKLGSKNKSKSDLF